MRPVASWTIRRPLPPRVRIWAAVATGFLLVPRAADADDRRTAEELFRAARAAYDRGDYRAAAVAFDEANQRAPNAAVVYNMALSWEAAGDAPRAADAYARAERDPSLDLESRNDSRSRLAALLPRVSTLTIRAPEDATIRIEQLERAHPPVVVHLAPGLHELRVDAAGRRPFVRSVVAVAGEALEVDAVLEPTASSPSAHAKIPHALGWALVGASGVAIAGSVVLGAETTHWSSVFQQSGDTNASARSTAIACRTAFWITVGGAALLGATGVTVLLLPRDSKTNTNTGVTIRASGISFESHFR